MYVLKSMLVNSSVVWLVVLLGTEFVSPRPPQLTDSCLYKTSHSGADFILILPVFVSC